MNKSEEKICLLCNNSFECKAGNITTCQCCSIQLTNYERDFIADKYADCLCLACIQNLQLAYRLSQNNDHQGLTFTFNQN